MTSQRGDITRGGDVRDRLGDEHLGLTEDSYGKFGKGGRKSSRVMVGQ